MGATEEFFKKKMAGSTGSTGTATDDFFKKKLKEKSAVTPDTSITKTPEVTPTRDLGIQMDKPIKTPKIQSVVTPDTAMLGEGTLSTGQGVKIQKAPLIKTVAEKKTDEDLRIKQADLIMGAKQLGQMYVEKLSTEDKDILITGLKNKEASLSYKDSAEKMQLQDTLLKDYGVDVRPKIGLPSETDISDPSLSPNPNDPNNWAFYEKKKREFDTTYEGKKILAYNKTAIDDPIENVNVALNIGRDQVFSTLGAIGEWMGVSDGSFRKQAEKSGEWSQLDFNKPLDDTNASIFDSRFWTQKVPQSIPFMVALAPAGIVGASMGSSLAGIAGLGQLGTYLATTGMAGIISRMAEGIAEGAGVYAELKDKGIDDKTASQEAFDTTKQNMWMVFSDMGQMAMTFAPVKKIPGLQNLLGKVMIPTAKFAFDATSEGGEEVFQGYVQQYNTAQGLGQKPKSIVEYLQSDEAREVFKLGAASGLAFASVGVAKDAYDNFIDRAQSQVDMVDEAVEKNDIDFLPKMDVLVKKEAISQETADAVKTLLDLKLQEQGTTVDEWMKNGAKERKAKINETRSKIQDLNTKMKEEKAQTPAEEKTYYHGALNDFEDFSLQKAGENTGWENAKFGIFFTEDKKLAENFVEDTRGSGDTRKSIIKEAGLDIKNPLDLTTEGIFKNKAQAPTIVKMLGGEEMNPEEALQYLDENIDLSNFPDLFETIYSDINNKKIMQEAGFDGIVSQFGKDENGNILKEYVAFEPAQIRQKKKEQIQAQEETFPPKAQEQIQHTAPENIDTLTDDEIVKKYTVEDMMDIQDKPDKTDSERNLLARYESIVYGSYQEEIKAESEANRMFETISEESDITYGDLEKLAYTITKTLRDPKARFGLKRGKDTTDMSSKTENYLRTSTESTIEALTQDFQSLKNGLMEIVKYYQMRRKHPYTRQKLRELHESLAKGEYDFLEQNSDLFTSVINPYLYEGKKPVSKTIGKTISRGTSEGGTSSNANVTTPSQEVSKSNKLEEQVNTLKQKAKEYKDFEAFFDSEIKPLDSYAPEFRNPVIEYWRQNVLKDLQDKAREKNVIFSTDPRALENTLNDNKELLKKYSVNQLENMSVEEKLTELLGKEYADSYIKEAIQNPFERLENFYKEAKKETTNEAGTGKKGIINALEEVKKAFPNITIEDISEKGMVVKGETLPMKEELKKAGGKWNPKYKGWIFPKTKKQMVQDLIDGNTTISDISTQKPVKEKSVVPQTETYTPEEIANKLSSQIGTNLSITEDGSMRSDIIKNPTVKNKLKGIGFTENIRRGNEYSYILEKSKIDNSLFDIKISKVKQPEEQKKQDTSKLRELAAKVIEKAEAEIGRDRQENTGRRAGMADSARDRARREIEVAKMMEKYADMVDSGEKVTFNIGSKTDMERMMKVFSRAEYMQEKEGGNIGKYIPDLFRVRIGAYRSDIDKVAPSVWAKATKAGVSGLKNFIYSATETVNANRYEKEIEYVIKNASDFNLNSWTASSMKEQLTDVKAYRKILNMNEDGEWNGPDILEQFQTMKNGAKVVESPEEALKRAERDIARESNIPGFFPTPEPLVDRMIREASIDTGMRVLEPSAGIGSIADRLRNIGIEPEVGEYNPTLSQHLEKKGYKVVSDDFMTLPTTELYDRIIMNPPFENLQDVDHVMKAFDNLQEGGRIVAIMSESPFFRTDKKSTEFRDWLDTVGYSEKLPEGSFKDALKTTGVNTRIVIIDKPKTEAKVEKVEEVPEVAPEEISSTPRFASIDTTIAMNASRGTSFDPERRGQSRISGFKAEMEELYNKLLPYAKTEAQQQLLRSEVSDLSGRLATRQNDINRAEGGVVSSMITGAARFPVARMQKRNDAIHKKNVEYIDFKERAINSIKKKLKEVAVEEAGGPIESLKKEIERMKANQEQAKQINATIRKYKTDEAIRPELEKLGISEKTITDLLTPYMGTRGIQSFSLTSLNNKIKEREAKLAKMEKSEAVKGTEDEKKTLFAFEGGTVVDNRAEDRVQILFDEKPTKDQIQELKKKGWRWSPTNSAWQRFRNSGSVQNAREMFTEVKQTPEIKEQGDSNAWIYDIIGAKYGVKPFAQEKIDIREVYIEAVNLAPEGWTVRVEDPTEANYLANVSAYADLATKEIVISSTEARKSTAAHEAVHASLSELAEDKRQILIDTARKQWQDASRPELTDEQAEEFLAEELKYYIESQRWKTKTLFGRLKEYLSKVWNTIKGVFGKDNKIKTFYEDILNGKIKRFETRTGKKFQEISDKEEYDRIDAEQFGYKLPPKLGIAYEKYEKEKTPSKVFTSFVEWGRRAFTPLDTAIGNISQKLRERMARFEYGVMNSEIVQEARPLMMKLSEKIKDKRETDDYRILDIALKNGDAQVVDYYAEKLGIMEELKEVRKVLDKIHEEASKLGIDIKYLENYFPRTVNNSVGLLSYLYKTEYGSQIKEAIKMAEVQKGRDLNSDEKAVIANTLLRGYKVAGVTLTPPGNVKARTIEQITKELNPFYNDSMDSLAIYIQGMNENIESRKLFGKGENLENSIGAYTMDLLAKGEITPVEEMQLTKAIQARFANNPMDAWVQAYRGISYLTTMGSVVSALTQIQDLSFSLYENGFMKSGEAWIQAVTGNSKITKEELGIHSIIQEFKEQGKIQGAVTKVFKMVGLEFMDRLGKETFVNAYYKKLQSEAMKGNLKGLEALGDRAQQAVQDLKDGKVTEDIKYILFARLCDFQPLTQSQMPEYYNTSGNMRIVYMLKTYTIKQIDVFRREAFAEIYEGAKRGGDRKRIVTGFKNLMFLTIALALLGAGTDTLKNLLLNRPFSVEDLVIDNVLKIMGFSKYTIYKVKEESVSAGILSLVVPPFNFFNDVITDVGDVWSGDIDSPNELQSINNIPIAGKLYYWWFGKGAIKSEKKRAKAAGSPAKPKTGKTKSPFSQDNGFKSTSGFKSELNFK